MSVKQPRKYGVLQRSVSEPLLLKIYMTSLADIVWQFPLSMSSQLRLWQIVESFYLNTHSHLNFMFIYPLLTEFCGQQGFSFVDFSFG